MPRPDVTPEFADAIQSGMVRPAFFVEANFASGPLRVWTGIGTLTWNSHTWTGVGTLGSITTVEEGATVEARGITITMSGIDVTLLADVLSEMRQGLPVIVYLALFDGGSPRALIPDPVIAFAGRMDQPTIDASGDTATVSIACESRLIEMNVSVEKRYDNETQQEDYPGDRGFEFVPSIQEVTIYWGRVPNSTNNL